jgi:Ca2+-binding RTX toxin-like protein
MSTYYVTGTKLTAGAPTYTLTSDNLFIVQGGELIADSTFDALLLVSNSFVQVDGAIYAGDADCIEMSSTGNRVTIGRTGVLSCGQSAAIRDSGSTNKVNNLGQVYADGVAIVTGANVSIVNGGTISGNGGIYLAGGRVTNTGEILGETYGIATIGGAVSTIVNSGLIAAYTAISSPGPIGVTVRNSGVIDGTIQCGGGAELIDSRNGVIIGSVYLNGGADVFRGGSAGELASGGADADLLNGGGGDDTLTGGLDLDQLHGMDGDDVLTGDEGADRIWGGAGADLIDGGAGNDLIAGNGGDDTLSGGKNADTFAFSAGFGYDVVADFNRAGVDHIRFAHNVFDNYADLTGHWRQAGTDVVIEADDGSILVLADTTVASLSAADFIFG